MTWEKSYDSAQRLDLLVARVAALEAASGPAITIGSWTDTSSMANGWGKGTGYFKYCKLTIGGLSFIFIDAQSLTTGTVADGTQIVTTALAGSFQPATQQVFTAYCDDTKAGVHNTTSIAGVAEMSALTLNADGTIHCYGIQSSATTVSAKALISLDH